MPKANPLRSRFGGVVAAAIVAIGVLLPAAAIAALALGALRAWVPVLDLLNLDRWLLLAAGGVGAVLLAAMRRRRAAAFAAASLGLTMALVPALPLAPTGDCARPLRLVQWNLLYGNRDEAAAAAWLRASGADVLLLQEARGGPGSVRERLGTDYPHRLTCVRREGCSTVILARARPDRRLPLARGDAENRRALSAARMDFGTVALVSLHLSRPWPPGHQLAEIALLEARLGDADPRRLIIGGDFNSGAAMEPLRRLGRRYGLARVDPGRPSWPAPVAVLRIDHLLVGSGWRVARAVRGPALGSDHRPQLVELCAAA